MGNRRRVIIMGAGGRDFHTFNLFFRDNKEYEVVAFTATQIPGIANRTYPPILSGRLYPNGIPIYEEERLAELIIELKVDVVVLAYSDLMHENVMHKASIAVATGADFWIIGQKNGEVISKKPVVAIVATRTGAGKTTVAKAVAEIIRDAGKRVVIVRHPMPYGQLSKEICQRFESKNDLVKNKCTVEEMEEYTPYLNKGFIVFAGVDYKKITESAEKESDIIVYEGGNNDFPLLKPDLQITVADPLRPGHEILSFPGEVNARSADIIVINKVNSAEKEDVLTVERNIKKINEKVTFIRASSVVTVDKPELIKEKRVAVVEDAPTITHGGLKTAAGYSAAKHLNAKIIDSSHYAVGSLKKIMDKYSLKVIPTLGYNKRELNELEKTINSVDCDSVLLGTSADLEVVISINKPIAKVDYNIDDKSKKKLESLIHEFFKKS